jgi:hypothetical protein
MADMQKILDTLARLDHDNDDQWLPDGTPKLGVVQKLANDQTIRRSDIEAAGIIRVNPLRADMIRTAISEHAGEPITVENLAQYLPADFELADGDLAPYQSATEQPIVFEGEQIPEAELLAGLEPTPEAIGESEARAFNAHRESQRAPIKAPEAESKPAPASPEAIEAAVIRRNKADQDLANARVLQLKENDKERELRTLLAKAVTNFQAAFPPITRETLMKDFVASEQARRASGEPATRQNRPGNSYLDRSRWHDLHGDAADFVRQSPPLTVHQAQKLVPGSAGPGTKGARRGGFPASMRQGPAKIHGER